MAPLSTMTVGPFASWFFRGRFAEFEPDRSMRERVARGLGDFQPLGVPLSEIGRAYAESGRLLWLRVSTKSYDLFKHFRNRPGEGATVRRLAALWSWRCLSCGADLQTLLGSPVRRCSACESERVHPAVFWKDPEARPVSVGPCKANGGLLECGGRGYHQGEILSLQRDLLGNLYAVVLAFWAGKAADMRLVGVSELPELGWREPVVLVEG